MDEVSPSTRRAIHADEQRLLRAKIIWRSPFFIGALLLWITADATPGSPLFFLLGLSALPVATATWAWWQHRRSDPLTAPAEQRDAAAERALVEERLSTHRSYATYTLAGLLVVVGALQLVLDGSVERSIAAAGLVKPAVMAGQWWRLISATYLHGSWWHIYGNITALLVLGRFVEAYSPRWRLPVIYASAAVAGSLASLLLLGKTSIGASGAILGLAGYLAAVTYLQPDALPKSVRGSVLTTIGLAAYFGAFGFSFIDNAAHVGGLLAGALNAWLTVPREDRGPGYSGGAQPQWNLIGAIAASLIIVGAGGTVAVLARARPAAVTSADVSLPSATIEKRAGPKTRSMVITNQSDRPIEAYRVSLRRDGQVLWTAWRDDCCFVGGGAQAPIAPHESRAIGPMPAKTGAGLAEPSLHLDVVIFADDSYEGSPEEYGQLIAQRQWAADSAEYWMKAIRHDRELPARAFYTSMTTRMEERLRQFPLERAAATALGVSALIIGSSSTSSLPPGIDDTLATMAGAHQALRARLVRLP